MNRMVKRLMVVLMSVFMVLGTVTTPVQAKDTSSNTNGWGNFWWWWPAQPTDPEPDPEPEPTEEPVVEEEEPVVTEEPIVEEEPVVTEEPVIEEEPVVEEETPVAIAYPEKDFEPVEINGTTVNVFAPEGALPEGTTLEVTEVSLKDVQAAVDAAADINGTVLAAVDITFYDVNGVKIEPVKGSEVKVSITAPEIAETENVEIVHIPDEAEPETIDQIEEDETAENEVAFVSDQFSVYAIITDPETGDETPYRTTYEFYNADGSIYYFKDAAGRDQHTQILKDGEILEDVGIPTKGASQNAKFAGWYVWNEDDDTLGEKVEVGEAKTVTANTTIKLKAKLQGMISVFFVTAVMQNDQGEDMERSIVTVKQVEYTVGQTEPITVDTSDVTTEAPTSEQAVVGWNRDETAANAGTAEGTNGVITLYENGNGTIADVMLFPAVHDAYWLYFDENDGGTGGGASYTPPEFVVVGGKPTRPADPHRTGYTFGGWYKDAACTQEFDFNEVMTETTTVYAKWVGSITTYTIIVKVQSTTDSAKITSSSNLSHEAKTYDFWKAYTIDNVQTGGTATVANTYKQLANQIDSSGYITYETCDDDKTIAADGSTILYVYYQRTVMTITWRRTTNANGAIAETWHGLYGASFAESGKTWLEPAAGYWWRSSAITWTYKDSFKDFIPAGPTMNLYYTQVSNSRYDIYFYTENLDGSWKLDRQFDFQNNSSFTFNEKYDAFSLYQYSRNNSTWSTARVGSSVNQNSQNLYIRFSRNEYDIEYHNGAFGTDGTIVRTDSIKYDAPLNTHTSPTVTYPVAADADHYDFIGWFADSSWKTMVTFTELDEQTKANYSAWYGVSEFIVYKNMPSHNFALYAGYSLKGWDCALDPNGGEFTNPAQAGVFWLQYGEPFSSDIKTNIKREGYVFQGWMLAEVPLDDDGNLDIDVVTRNNLRFVGDDSNWTMTDEPWQFETGITGPTALIAKWFYKTTMTVVYDAGDGTDAPEDNGKYSDHAQTVAFRAPVAPENANFIGWDIEGTNEEEHLQPGDTFEVNSDYAVDGVVTLVAVYHTFNQEEEVPVTHIDWYANNTETAEYVVGEEDGVEIKETQLLHVSNVPLQLNEAVDIRPATTFTNNGYKFLGWAKLHKDGETLKDHKNVTVVAADKGMDYALTADNLYLKYEDEKFLVEVNGEWVETSKVAADEYLPYDDLYAVWEEEFFYIYHSSNQSVQKVSLVGIDTFDITDTVKEGFMYGGYYKDYARKGTYKGGETATQDGTNYNGGLGYWSSRNAWGSAKENGEGGIGTAMTPVAGHTYYLKEVSDKYLNNLLYIIYDTRNNNTVVKNYLITNVDDNNYQDIGLIAENIETGERVKLSSAFTITNTFTGKTDKISARKPYFDTTAGYIGVWNPTLATEDYNFASTYTTYDGVKVEGSWVKNVTLGDGRYYETFDDTAENSGYKTSNTANTYLKPEHAGHLSVR